jgi:putative nucleotidyltransferase with HDIG domain
MVSNALALEVTTGQDALIEDIVTSLPESTYRNLPLASEVVIACLRRVSDARRDGRPRAIQQWIDLAMQQPTAEDLLACLDATIARLAREAKGSANHIKELDFLHRIRREAVSHLDELGARQRVDAVITDETHRLADGLVAMVGMYDQRLAEHLNVVGDLAERLATSLGLGPNEAAKVKLAGRLHDVGKVAVSRTILLKPMQLTSEEWEQVKLHPQHGANILGAIPALEPIAKIIEAHHERMDGRGYPYQRQAYEIPPESRIVAIVDAFDAMTTPRPYSRPRTLHDACAELLDCAGSQFDADYVEAFVDLIGFRRRGVVVSR